MTPPLRTILGVAVPLALSAGAGLAARLAATSLLGHQATTELAAFALAGAVHGPVTAAVSGGLRGLTPFVAPHRDRPAAALPALRDARWLALVLGVAGAGVVLCVPLIAWAGGVPGEVTAGLGALPPLLAVHVLLLAAGGGANGTLVALGHARQVLRSSLAGAATEVVLLLALVPWLGVMGAGVALVAATAVTVVIANGRLARLTGLTGRTLWPGRPRPREILRMARVGVPMSAALVVKFAALGGAAYAAARTGADGAAAHAILVSLDGPLTLAAFTAGQAAAPEIARAVSGPGKVTASTGDRTAAARRISRAALVVAAAGALTGTVLLAFLGEEVLGLFTADGRVRAAAAGLLPLLGVFALVNGCAIVMSAALTGLRRSAWSLGAVAAGYGPLALVAAPVTAAWGLTGLWCALAACAVLVLGLQTWGFRRHSARR
ncbi:polysaccharide biosynthesis C-terminal domain-containing protein [Nonomuraea sp. NPDC047897]|uniref:polysaccharide biosynthesis C-terminal domain-containing protein n=1 Tax=Nonomuraea sp. NPDC047897 TaxID=3364346 RepID=UPI00371CC149